MKPAYRYKAIVFDMDNTLLRSRIDFPRIKRDVFSLLSKPGVFPADFPIAEHTIATLIEAARATEGFTPDLEAEVWEIVVRGEREGMHEAELEPDVEETLRHLHGKTRLTVLTNNARAAALEALERTGIVSRFELIAGREQMTALKPSPSGVDYIRGHYPEIAPEDWLSVGDSWIDGKAAEQAGISFLAYKTSIAELERRGIPAIGHIRSMRELIPFLQG